MRFLNTDVGYNDVLVRITIDYIFPSVKSPGAPGCPGQLLTWSGSFVMLEGLSERLHQILVTSSESAKPL